MCRVKWWRSRNVSWQMLHFSLSSRFFLTGSNSRLWCDLMWYTRSLVILNDALHFAHQFCARLIDCRGVFKVAGPLRCSIFSTMGLALFMYGTPALNLSANITCFVGSRETFSIEWTIDSAILGKGLLYLVPNCSLTNPFVLTESPRIPLLILEFNMCKLKVSLIECLLVDATSFFAEGVSSSVTAEEDLGLNEIVLVHFSTLRKALAFESVILSYLDLMFELISPFGEFSQDFQFSSVSLTRILGLIIIPSSSCRRFLSELT